MIIAVVIPAVFNSFGMEPSGRFLRRVFDGYSQITTGILLFLFVTASSRFLYDHTSGTALFPVTRLEGIVLGLMVSLTFFIVWVIGPQTVLLQEKAFEATTAIDKKMAYDQFFQWHVVQRGLHLATLGLAVGLFIHRIKKGMFNLDPNKVL
jgi:hypothetical protein